MSFEPVRAIRATLTCIHCVSKKSKCDRLRPSCSACRKSGLLCSYRPRKSNLSATHGMSSSAVTASSYLPSSAQTLQDRLERLEAIVGQHQQTNSLSCNDPVDPQSFLAPIATISNPPLAREELKAYFIDSLRPNICLMTAEQITHCCAESPLVTFAVCALAALFAPASLLPASKCHELFVAYYKAAKTGIASMFEQPEVSSIFGLLLITMVSSADRGPRVTYYYGSVVQMAMRLGLNNESAISKAQNDFYKSLMRNVWWSIYMFDRWLLTTEVGIEAVRDSDCKLSLPVSKYNLNQLSSAAALERAQLEISLMTSDLPFVPSLPHLGIEGSQIMLAKISGRIVLANRDAANIKMTINPAIQLSLERSLDDFAAFLPDIAKQPELLFKPLEYQDKDPLTLEWLQNKWRAVFISTSLFAARVTLYRYTLLDRLETQTPEYIYTTKDFTESFKAVTRALELISLLQQNGAEFGSLFVLLLANLFNIALVLPVCVMMPLTTNQKFIVDSALKAFCTTMDILSARLSPTPSYSEVVRTICASGNKTYVIEAIKLAAKDMDLPQLPDTQDQSDAGTDTASGTVSPIGIIMAESPAAYVTTGDMLSDVSAHIQHAQHVQSSTLLSQHPAFSPPLDLSLQPINSIPHSRQLFLQQIQFQQQLLQASHHPLIIPGSNLTPMPHTLFPAPVLDPLLITTPTIPLTTPVNTVIGNTSSSIHHSADTTLSNTTDSTHVEKTEPHTDPLFHEIHEWEYSCFSN
ncbi:hypothetical protein BDEG_27153 [Batrachochytrium dendrobatidis JEL423]|uniref:Zn(2)-C6 fungal-type domain-containing protein n=1 Tax=Batrachochytrium dendrobatidis (strain JEL423) TaxID=403673 RepID=A0A177WUT5_BATDL|nr:hypothetical protein BDEG_27153 [Batrachochytrium dendrobatidis JEL423]